MYYKNSALQYIYFTIFSGVADDRVWLGPVSFPIDSLNFDLKGREFADVEDGEGRCCCVVAVPVGPAAHHSPPQHPVLEVRAVEVTFVHFLQQSEEQPVRLWKHLFDAASHMLR